ncbi:MAG: hypothetical protein FWG66_07725, partial [Spirochaetes bacterium]|nr:hypothetical protein [Spirochaetota bacterium]
KARDVIKTLFPPASAADAGRLDDESLPRFFSLCLEMAGEAFKAEGGTQSALYSDIFRKAFNEAGTATGVLNQSASLAMEALFYRLKTGAAQAGAAP